MVRVSKKKNLVQIINFEDCSPKFYEHTAVIQANFQDVERPMIGYGLTISEAIQDLKKKGYNGEFVFVWVPNPNKRYIFAAA